MIFGNFTARNSAHSRMRAGLCLLMALMLLGATTPAKAFAAEANTVALEAQSAATVGTATLQIVYGLDFNGKPNVIVNKSYAFYENATYADLLDAAVAAGDIKGYELNAYGYLQSVTKADGTVVAGAANSSTYWGNYENGVYYAGSDTMKTEKLVDGVKYQIAWCSYPTAVAPSWSALPAPSTDTAHIAGGATATGTATLQIVYGLDFNGKPNVIVNKTYGFADGSTYADLLDAAVAAGDIKGYELNAYGYLQSVAKADGTVVAGAANSSTYWGNYENGVYYTGSDTMKTEKLANGMKYQIAWCSYPTATVPDWNALPAAGSGAQSAGTATKIADTTPVGTPAAVGTSARTALFAHIQTSYAGTGMDWKAMDLAASGKAATVDSATVIANAVSAYGEPDSTNLQRSIIALTALGIDATDVKGADGTSYDLVKKLGSSATSQDTLIGRAFALLAYACGPYDVPSDALKSKQTLVDEVLADQHADGGFSYSGTATDADVTGMVVAALAPLRANDAAVEIAASNALSALHAIQKSDGGFAMNYQGVSASNADSTAMAVIALCAAGMDPATTWATANGATPLSALLSFANSDNTAFTYEGADNDFATEQGFRALVAYQGLVNSGTAYNIYVQASEASAALPASSDTTKTTGGGKAISANAGNASSDETEGAVADATVTYAATTTAETSDNPLGASLSAVGFASALACLCVAVQARKRERMQEGIEAHR